MILKADLITINHPMSSPLQTKYEFDFIKSCLIIDLSIQLKLINTLINI